MTANEYVLWFIATALAVSALLALGTLAAAGLIRRPQRGVERPGTVEEAPDKSGRHHWHDRFHFHHAA